MLVRENLIDKFAVQVDGGYTFKTVHNDVIKAMEEAKRLPKKEMRVAYVVNIVRVITPSVMLTIKDRSGETMVEA